jgi:hypothetical protein
VHHFKPEAGDPLHEAGKGCRIGQFSAKGCAARADGDFAVVELCPQYRARLAREGDLIRSWLHQGDPSRSAVLCAVSVPGARACVITA